MNLKALIKTIWKFLWVTLLWTLPLIISFLIRPHIPNYTYHKEIGNFAALIICCYLGYFCFIITINILILFGSIIFDLIKSYYKRECEEQTNNKQKRYWKSIHNGD